MPHPTDPGSGRLEVHTTSPDAAGDTLIAYAELSEGRWQVAHRDGRAVTVTSRVEVLERLLAVCAHTSSCDTCDGLIEYVSGTGTGWWRHCLPPDIPHHAVLPRPGGRPT